MESEYQSVLFDRILTQACAQAEAMLCGRELAEEHVRHAISDLELSPLLDKQIMATALRLADELSLAGGLREKLLARFRSALPGVAVTAQRRSIESEVRDKGLPMILAGDYVDILEKQIEANGHNRSQMLWAYAQLYGELWCDPRISARTPTRRIMLAMSTVLRGRSAHLAAAPSRVDATMAK